MLFKGWISDFRPKQKLSHKPFHRLVISITHYKNWLITTNNTKKQRLVWGFYIL